MKATLLCAIFCFVSASTLHGATTKTAPRKDPVGDFANYKVDKNKNRTSDLIKNGWLATRTMEMIPGTEGHKSYRVEIPYEIDVLIGGKQKGTSEVVIPESYFTETFWQELRQNGSYESDKFKVRYLSGNVTVATMQGQTYENCDQVLIYDIDTKGLRSPKDQKSNSGAGVKDLEIVMFRHPSVPVLGGVRLDARATYLKQKVKLGADYWVE